MLGDRAERRPFFTHTFTSRTAHPPTVFRFETFWNDVYLHPDIFCFYVLLPFQVVPIHEIVDMMNVVVLFFSFCKSKVSMLMSQ